jgi:hypothetical protein
MTAQLNTPTKLSPIQLNLIRLFSQRNVSDEETLELGRLISKYYSDKAEQALEQHMAEQGIKEIDFDAFAEMHLRTPYK